MQSAPMDTTSKFLSTPSVRRATKGYLDKLNAEGISIHALREEGDSRSLSSGLRHGISIHALREEGDCSVDDTFDRSIFISIHALREEGDAGHCGRCGGAAVISIHALREEGDQNLISSPAKITISIHALREEGDRGCRVFAARHMPFLSTPSARRATCATQCKALDVGISIHALREEGDGKDYPFCRFSMHFYPRPPRGGRHWFRL